MKPFFSILLLTLWLVQSLFSSLCYSLERQQCRIIFEKNKENYTPKNIQYLVFSSNQSIAWEKRNEEFFWQGNLYDVLSITQTDASITIKCVSDSTETDIVAQNTSSFSTNFYKSKSISTFKIQEFIYTFLENLPLFTPFLRIIPLLAPRENTLAESDGEVLNPPPEEPTQYLANLPQSTNF